MRVRLGIAAAVVGALVCAITVQNTLLAATPAPKQAATLSWVPSTLRGLTVQPENVAGTLAQDRRALWVDEVRLYSLRHGKELDGTLEVARFTASAPWRSPDFDLSLAGQLGASTPVVVELGGVRVYVTGSRGLQFAAWFERGWMLVLGIRTTDAQPKELIRQALELKP
jgi:hypothetical protein